MTDRFADALLRLAARIAPNERRSWIAALGAEAEILEDPALARRWALGSLVAALGWSARKDLLFFVILGGVGHWLAWIYGDVMDLMQAGGVGFFDAASWSRMGCVVLLSAMFAAWRPDRAIFAAVLTPTMIWEGLVRSLTTDGTHNWLFGLLGAYDWVWPAVVGAALGSFVGRRFRSIPERAR